MSDMRLSCRCLCQTRHKSSGHALGKHNDKLKHIEHFDPRY
jgi:hypothetical protein